MVAHEFDQVVGWVGEEEARVDASRFEYHRQTTQDQTLSLSGIDVYIRIRLSRSPRSRGSGPQI